MYSLSSNIFVNDINQTIEFYRELGFKLIDTVPEQSDFVWAMMTCSNVTFMFQTVKQT
jgi:catechol 2,3-dioxygenase-like lactoylglutathione lyase family enzyme